MPEKGKPVPAAHNPAPLDEPVDVTAYPLATGGPVSGEDEIPPEFGWDWPDPDCGRPPELAGLTYEELDALPATIPARYREPAWPIDLPGPEAAAGQLAGSGASVAPLECWPRDGSGGGVGFADGGVLDTAPAGLALAGFTADAQAQLGVLSDDELVGVIRAWRRLASWAAAGELEAIAALARRRPADGTPPAAPGEPFPGQVSEFAGEEVAAALTLTPVTGGRVVDLAIDLAGRLAPVRVTLAAGWIDLPKARLFAQATEDLTDAHAAAVVAAVLPQAPELTNGRLRRALDRAVLAADPEAAQRQRETALADARVECWPDPCGTANLAGRNLPAASVLAADKRLDAIARAWQAAGATGGIDQLRARAYLAQLLSQDTTQPPADLLPQPTPGTQPDPRGQHHAPTSAPPGHSGSHPPGQPVPAGLQPPPSAGQPPSAGLPPSAGQPPSPGLPPLAGSVNLTIPLVTLLGLADRPGEAGGYGPLDPDTARALACAAAGHRATRWHVTLTGPTDRALGYGSTPASRAHTVRDGSWQVSVTAEPIAAGCCDHRTAEPHYRPSAALQRIIRTRTTTCSYHGCGRPAARCDLDHTIPYDDGGITCECDLAPLCRRHHRMKQARQWTLEQVSPGVMAWLTPAGRRYTTLPSQHPT